MANTPALIETVRHLPGSRRFATLATVAVAVVVLVMVGIWVQSPTYVTLYQGLEPREIGTISDRLREEGIVFQLGAGGTSIDVPVADAPRARVVLAQANLPAGGRPGLELFDRPAWGMTDFTQRVTYRRALEGELARTIGTLQGIRRAQVHLTLPESSPLRRLERPAEAAVVLALQGPPLSRETVQGIAYLVSNSVEQLSAENVAVMDDAGRLLSGPTDGGAAGGFAATGRQLELQQGVEDYLERKVNNLLGAVLGPGTSRVQVSARLNFEQVDRTIETYDPDGQVIASEQRSEVEPGAEGAGGLQTVVNNSYQNSRQVERIVGAVGNVGRLTVSVMVDQTRLSTGSDPGLPRRDDIELAVRNAVGYDETRGDQVAVIAVPFEAAAVANVDSLAPPAGGTDFLGVAERMSRPILGLIAILAAFMLGSRALKGLRPAAVPALAGGAAPAGVMGGSHLVSQMNLVAPSAAAAALRDEIQAQTAAAPDSAAKVVRAWLAEDE